MSVSTRWNESKLIISNFQTMTTATFLSFVNKPYFRCRQDIIGTETIKLLLP